MYGVPAEPAATNSRQLRVPLRDRAARKMFAIYPSRVTLFGHLALGCMMTSRKTPYFSRGAGARGPGGGGIHASWIANLLLLAAPMLHPLFIVTHTRAKTHTQTKRAEPSQSHTPQSTVQKRLFGLASQERARLVLVLRVHIHRPPQSAKGLGEVIRSDCCLVISHTSPMQPSACARDH